MKKITLVLSMLCLVTISFAQIRRDVPMDSSAPKISKKSMMDELKLTKEQRSQWKQIQQNNKMQKEVIMNNDSLNADQKKIQLKELHKQTAKSIDAILTDTQREQFKQMKEENRAAKTNNINNTMQEPNQ
jgi:protein CpxP